jgi:predicted metal-dependent HD superfamily phosphohydrolase
MNAGAIKNTGLHLSNIEFNNNDASSMVSKLLLDIDLVGFADDMNVVRYNSNMVLREYECMNLLPGNLLLGRLYFLEKLLKKEKIFYTDYFYELYENKLRRNVNEEINLIYKELG